jgi:hypothetical protein
MTKPGPEPGFPRGVRRALLIEVGGVLILLLVLWLWDWL